MQFISLFLLTVILMAAVVYPFLPGEYDALSIPVATSVQLYSGAGLLTCIPALLWWYQSIQYSKQKTTAALKQIRLYIKIYVWINCFAVLLVVLITTFGLSKLLGVFLFVCLLLFSVVVLKSIAKTTESVFFSRHISLWLAVLPVVLLLVQLLVDDVFTSRSRQRAIANGLQLIEDIERYKTRNGKYPLTLNAGSKDYKTGLTGIEKYYYTYDDTTYNLYFEQPRFFYDQFGTREFVVYNPNDNHMILSHASWNFEPGQRRATQGWYAFFDTGVPHWKYFWFD